MKTTAGNLKIVSVHLGSGQEIYVDKNGRRWRRSPNANYLTRYENSVKDKAEIAEIIVHCGRCAKDKAASEMYAFIPSIDCGECKDCFNKRS